MTTRALTSGNVLFSIPDIEGLTVRWPINGVVYPYGDSRRPAVTQPFAYQLHPPSPFRHYGADLGIPTGTPVVAAHSGLISFVQAFDSGDYGIHVFVRHVWGFTLYAHLSRMDVSVGEPVLPGTQLGLSGNTGLSTASHLHVEARLTDNATRFDWLPYVNKVIRKTDEEWFMSLTDARRSALEEVADAQIHGQVLYAGSPGKGLLKRFMDTLRDLPLDPGESEPAPGVLRKAQTRALNGAGAAVKRWGRKP